MQPTSTPEPRLARPPGAQAATGTISGAIANSVTAAIVANNPGLVLLAPVVGSAIDGVLSGAGGWARDTIASGRATGWRGLAYLLRWLG